jgi:hypothetical protein
MDAELEGKSDSRNLDMVDGSTFGGDYENRNVAENAHVLKNLLQSLEASAGTSGPVSNILKEMDQSGT